MGFSDPIFCIKLVIHVSITQPCYFARDVIISSVVPGDYDGDSQMDVLLTTYPKGKNTEETKVTIYWGNNQTLGGLFYWYLLYFIN